MHQTKGDWGWGWGIYCHTRRWLYTFPLHSTQPVTPHAITHTTSISITRLLESLLYYPADCVVSVVGGLGFVRPRSQERGCMCCWHGCWSQALNSSLPFIQLHAQTQRQVSLGGRRARRNMMLRWGKKAGALARTTLPRLGKLFGEGLCSCGVPWLLVVAVGDVALTVDERLQHRSICPPCLCFGCLV